MTGKTRGGGVLIACLKKYVTSAIKIETYLETIFVEINVNGNHFILNCTYMHPQSSYQCYRDYVDLFTDIDKLTSLNTQIIIIGDFNLPFINGLNFNLNCKNRFTTALFELMNLYDLNQLNNCLNEDFRTLDLVFGNREKYL